MIGISGDIKELRTSLYCRSSHQELKDHTLDHITGRGHDVPRTIIYN